MTDPTGEQFDVVVVGGGPAGSTVATLVAKQGHRVLILEREEFPRYQIGESLLPATIHGICELLGVGEEIRAAGFTVKRGGTFRWGANPEPWTFNFALSSRMAGPSSYAFQVERMRFDDILLKNARRVGVDVRERCTALETIGDERVEGVRYLDADGVERTVAARFVLDASGNASRLHKRVGGPRRYSEFFRSLAIFGYFENGKRLPGPQAGNILSAAFPGGWFWYIPLSETLTSVGAVVHRDSAHRVQGDPDAVLRELIDECPTVADMLSDARRVTGGPYGEIRVRKDYSYHKDRFWSPGMALVGDAACFVDPVFSSGVHLATYSGLLAARSVNSVLAGTVGESAAFAEYERRYRSEYAVFYEFLVAFYELHVDERSYFWQAKKIMNCEIPEMEAFVELVGGVASGEFAFSGPDAVLDQLAASTGALGEAVGIMTAPAPDRLAPAHRVPIVERIRIEGAKIQVQAILGNEGDGEGPVFRDGLTVSPDGMRWEHQEAG